MITLEVTTLERKGTGTKGDPYTYKVTLQARSKSTIYDHMAFIHLSAEEAKGVSIGDKWSVIEHSVLAEPEPSGGPMALVYDRVLADREHAGESDGYAGASLDMVPDVEDGRG